MLSSDHIPLLRPAFELGKGKKLFQDNERDILKTVFWQQDTTQSSLVERTRIPQQTMSRLVKSLIERKVLKNGEQIVGNRGKPAYVLEFNGQFAYCIGVSILLDAISVAILDFSGKVIASSLKALQDMSIKTVLHESEMLAKQLITQHSISTDRLLGMGVGISGFFTSTDGKMNTHHKLEDWALVDISKLFSDYFKLPTWVVNDATAAAAGEGMAGVGRNYKNFVYLFISAAFGGGLVSNGDILHGTHGNAGELGDMIPPKLYVHPNLEILKRILLKNGIEIDSIYNLQETFDINWPGVEEWTYKVQDALDFVATACSAILDSQALIIGGHIPRELAEKLIPKIEIYAQFRRGAKRPLPEIVPSSVKQHPVAVGAATLPIRAICL
ncbi:ROK family transcriptional regulator [Catenovulum sediminis]|uniref:ROK family transcriptional regulator n=1 Tax=Catenovulum sediminis TaxID=1740262 RepID=UPI003314815F